MTVKEVIQLLMMSPFYFRLNLEERRELLRYFCKEHNIALSIP